MTGYFMQMNVILWSFKHIHLYLGVLVNPYNQCNGICVVLQFSIHVYLELYDTICKSV